MGSPTAISPLSHGILDTERWGNAAPLIAAVERVHLAVNALTMDVRELDLRDAVDPAVIDWVAKYLAAVALSQGDILHALSLRLGRQHRRS